MAFVQIRNEGDAPLRFADNSQVVVVPPKGEAIVDREAAVRLLGDWSQRNYPPDQRRMFRHTEYMRIRGHYGALPGGLYQDKINTPDGIKVVQLDPDELWAERRPHVRVVEDGRPVTLVIDDPDGTTLPPETQSEIDKERMIATLVEQQAQMAEMIAKLQADLHQERIVGVGAEVTEIAEDTPEVAPNRRRTPMRVSPPDRPMGDDES